MAVWPLEEDVLGVFHVRQIVDDGNDRKMACNEYFGSSLGKHRSGTILRISFICDFGWESE